MSTPVDIGGTLARDHSVYFEDNGKKYRATLTFTLGPLYKDESGEYRANVRASVVKVEPIGVIGP